MAENEDTKSAPAGSPPSPRGFPRRSRGRRSPRPEDKAAGNVGKPSLPSVSLGGLRAKAVATIRNPVPFQPTSEPRRARIAAMHRLIPLLLLLSFLPASGKPNVVILLADDLGYQDIGCYGGPVKTPALDGLAAGGARFTDFYSGCAVCSPSRATLLTGRHHIRTGVYSWIHDASAELAPARARDHHCRNPQRRTATTPPTSANGTSGSRPPSGDKPTPTDKHGFDYWFATWNNAQPIAQATPATSSATANAGRRTRGLQLPARGR